MSIFSKVFSKVSKIKVSLFRNIKGIFSQVEKWGDEDFKNLEKLLISNDLGVKFSINFIKEIREDYDLGNIRDVEGILEKLNKKLIQSVESGQRDLIVSETTVTSYIFMGVNGSGKTTVIAKIAHLLKKQGKSVMLAACDTFRAAAVDQLAFWANKLDVPMVKGKDGQDPASVAFEALKQAKEQKVDFLLIDTSGRLHTKDNLMRELEKIVRVLEKQDKETVQEKILVIDGSLGTNSLQQMLNFNKFVSISGLIVNKLDGSSKGGIICSMKEEKKLPIFYLGVGEKIDDIKEFNPESFVKTIADYE